MQRLIIDDKWSVLFEPTSNDRPIAIQRYREKSSEWDESNCMTAMFYALLAAKGSQPA